MSVGREFKVQTVTVELVELQFLTRLDNSLEMEVQNGKLRIEEFLMFFFKRKVIFFSFVQRVLNGRDLREICVTNSLEEKKSRK